MQHSMQSQQGATLFVALIILVVVTLIGVTAMKNANVEEQMASNLYQKNLTFQASESAVESTIDDSTLIELAMTSNSPVEKTVDVPIPNTTATVSYAAVGAGMALGSSANLFSGMRLMITATGRINDLNAQTTTVHGVVRLAPGPG